MVELEAEAGGYNYGGSGGTGGAAGTGAASRGGGGGRGGQSYYTQPATNNINPIPTHTRTSELDGQVLVSMIGL